MSYEIKQAKKRSLRAFYPLIGLIMLIISGAIAFFGYQPFTDFLLQNGLPPDVVNVFGSNFPIAVGGFIFTLVLLILTLFTAIAAGRGGRGRDAIVVKEKDLSKERADRMREEKAAKQRKLKMQKKMAEQRRKNR